MKRLWLTVLAACILFSACSLPAKAPVLEILALDVGQGSCLLVRTPEGDILIDAGAEAGQDRLVSRLHEMGVERIDLLILTHPDEDHLGGGDAIVYGFEVGAVWHNGDMRQSEGMKLLCRALEERSVPLKAVKTGDGINHGALAITVLSPATVTEGNAGSLVLKLDCLGLTALIMGDADQRVEAALLQEYGASQLGSTLLVAGHHGSHDAGSEAFLQAVAPRYTVISCEAGNAYGFPDGRTLARLEAVGSEILRTDLHGEICLRWMEGEATPTVITEGST